MKFSIITVALCSIIDFSSCINLFYLMFNDSVHISLVLGKYSLFSYPCHLLYHTFHCLWHETSFSCLEKSAYLSFGSGYSTLSKKSCQILYHLLYHLLYKDVELLLYLLVQFFFMNDEWFILLSYSLLIPQIVHNVRLGMKPSFDLKYILGFVSIKILQPIYERGCP